MYSEPHDLDPAALAGALGRNWNIRVTHFEYMPVGFGSHHWRAVGNDGAQWFVSVDDAAAARHAGTSPEDVFAVLERAFRTAAAVREDGGLDFVVAPVRSHRGDVLHRLDTSYAMRVEPLVEGWAGADGEFELPEERRWMGTLLGRLHDASASVPSDLPGREDFTLPGRAALDEALGRLRESWHSGPFAEPARALLREHAGEVRERLRSYDQRAGALLDEPAAWVVTHGEPHSANVIRDPTGGLRLVDWDSALISPRERDLWMVLDAGLSGWDEYRAVAGPVSLRGDVLALYRDRWALAEIAVYITEFRRPHEESEDTRTSWHELGQYLG